MGQGGGAVWRYGFADKWEIAEAEACVTEYVHHTHVEGFEYGEKLRLFLRGGGVREFDKNTVLVDCRGSVFGESREHLKTIQSSEYPDFVLYTFLTDQTDSASAYSASVMFISGNVASVQQIKPLTNILFSPRTAFCDLLRYMYDMAKVRKGIPMSDAHRLLTSECGVFDLIQLWWLQNKIRTGKKRLRIDTGDNNE